MAHRVTEYNGCVTSIHQPQTIRIQPCQHPPWGKGSWCLQGRIKQVECNSQIRSLTSHFLYLQCGVKLNPSVTPKPRESLRLTRHNFLLPTVPEVLKRWTPPAPFALWMPWTNMPSKSRNKTIPASHCSTTGQLGIIYPLVLPVRRWFFTLMARTNNHGEPLVCFWVRLLICIWFSSFRRSNMILHQSFLKKDANFFKCPPHLHLFNPTHAL